MRIAATRPSIISGGSDDVGARFGIGRCNSAEKLDRRIVVDVAGRIDDPAMAVDGVFATTQVDDDEHLGQRRFDRTNRALDDAVLIVGARRGSVFVGWHAEEQNTFDSNREELASFGNRAVEVEARDARHRIDWAGVGIVLHDEEWLDELLGRNAVLANKSAHDLASA